ncbi:hypothetical protein [Rhizobium sp. BR 362]|uniref:hypothetical protein n=1 Tax=Rhizobium sp. BR 362 TaxID=3040670 RepID=UPI002F41DC91
MARRAVESAETGARQLENGWPAVQAPASINSSAEPSSVIRLIFIASSSGMNRIELGAALIAMSKIE